MNHEYPESPPPFEYSEDPVRKMLQMELKKALEKLGQDILSMTADKDTIRIETDKAALYIVNLWISAENPDILEGEMLIGRHLTAREERWRLSTIYSDDPRDHEKFMKMMNLKEKHLRKLLEALGKNVFANITPVISPDCQRLNPKFHFKFAFFQKIPKIAAATKTVRNEIRKKLAGGETHGPKEPPQGKEPPPGEEKLSWTVDK